MTNEKGQSDGMRDEDDTTERVSCAREQYSSVAA